MATFYHHACDRCGYSFETKGPKEWFRDANGRLADYGHPVASSQEAKDAGIAGLYWDAWCLNRDTNVDVVTTEFEHPAERDDFWRMLRLGELPEKAVPIVCAACGDGTPVMGLEPFGPSFTCPKCGGTIHCKVTGGS
jgi:hypothetical protein